MLDLKPHIANFLKAAIDVELSFPSKAEAFPVAILSETENSSDLILNGVDRLSYVSFQIDIYDTDPKRVEDKAAIVSVLMLQKGFKRTFGSAIPESGLYRKSMRFSATIDEVTKRIYKN